MHIVTFYSYRGGVGRTTLLVNTAIELAHRGRTVLVVDFSLRAPGLASFDLFLSKKPTPGVVEYISEYLESGQQPDIQPYLRQIDPLGEDCGEIWAMPAGRGDDDYWLALNRIDWNDLYDRHDGFRFFQRLRWQWQQGMAGRKPDYVLIDTHAGIGPETDTCKLEIPDSVVLVFTPAQATCSPQSQREHDRNNAEYNELRRWCGGVYAEVAARKDRALAVHFVASKVPDRPDERNELWYGHGFEGCDLLSDEAGEYVTVIIVPHATSLEYGRRPLVRERGREHSRLAQVYRRVVNAILRSNFLNDRDGMMMFLARLQQAPNQLVESDRPFGLTNESRNLKRLEDHCDDPTILAEIAACYYLAGRHQEAIGVIGDALKRVTGGTLQEQSRCIQLLWQKACYNRRIYPTEAIRDLLRLLDSAAAPSGAHSVEPLEKLLVTTPQRRSIEINNVFANHEVKEYQRLVNTVDALENAPPDIRYIVSALRRLGELAPSDKFREAMRKPAALALPEDVRDRLFAGRPLVAPPDEPKPRLLMRRRCWDELAGFLQPRLNGPGAPRLIDALHFFVAVWGQNDKDRIHEACRLVKRAIDEGQQLQQQDVLAAELNPETPPEIVAFLKSQQQKPADELNPLLTLALWKGGYQDCASERLSSWIGESRDPVHDTGEIFSYWRCRYIPVDLFRADAYEQLQMMKSGRVQSPALGLL